MSHTKKYTTGRTCGQEKLTGSIGARGINIPLCAFFVSQRQDLAVLAV